MREIHRTLRPGGVCLFTTPTYPDLVKSEQVAFREADGSVRVVGEPEYHGNPQSP
jgi:SAM-dependent methyltransferase